MTRMQRFINWAQTPFAKRLLAVLGLVSQAAHLMFYTWPLTARLVPNVVEVLRLPAAFVLTANLLFLSLPLLLMSLFMRFCWRRDGVLAERLTEPRNRRPLRTGLLTFCFDVTAITLLLRFHTRDVAASLFLQLMIVALTLVFLLWDIKRRLRDFKK